MSTRWSPVKWYMSSARLSSSAMCVTRCSHRIRHRIGTATFLSPTGVSLLSLLQVFHIPFTHVSVFSIKQAQCKYPHPQCNTHSLAVRTVTARAGEYHGDSVSPDFVRSSCFCVPFSNSVTTVVVHISQVVTQREEHMQRMQLYCKHL